MTGMSEADRLELTRGILSMLDDWDIAAKDQLVLLGMERCPCPGSKPLA